MIRIAGIIRKSPSKEEDVKNSVENQKIAIYDWCRKNLEEKYNYGDIDFFIDENISGDDPNRPELQRFFKLKENYDFVICRDADRYVRDPIGLVWFEQYLLKNRGLDEYSGCKMVFIDGVPNLYDEDGRLVESSYLTLAFLILLSKFELSSIRKRTSAGRKRVMNDPALRKQKYKGRKPGSKNKVKK